MNSNDVIAVIDVICDKLGIAAEAAAQIVPRLAKVHIAEQVSGIVLLTIASLILLALCKRFYPVAQKKADKTWEYTDATDVGWYLTLVVATVAVCIVWLLASFILIPDTVSWIVAPDAKAVQYVINMIGG